MSRDWRLYLDDLVAACEKVLRYTKGMSKQEFSRDDRTFDAVMRNLEIIGEASKHVAQEEPAQNLQVEWRKIVALRNIISHEYFGIDEDIVWDIVSSKIQPLLTEIKKIQY